MNDDGEEEAVMGMSARSFFCWMLRFWVQGPKFCIPWMGRNDE
jgi:hypothetical protein